MVYSAVKPPKDTAGMARVIDPDNSFRLVCIVCPDLSVILFRDFTVPHRLHRDNQHNREQQTLQKSISSHRCKYLSGNSLPRIKFSSVTSCSKIGTNFKTYSCLVISTAFVVVSPRWFSLDNRCVNAQNNKFLIS